nr:MAG TPA: deoxyribosyltransferase [Caudoviricetes sp.]
MKIRNSEGYMDFVAYKAIMNVDREKKAETKSAFRPLIYVCAPFNGDIEGNKKKAAEFAHFAYKQGCIPVTPHLLFPFMNDESPNERALALHMDIVLMGKCQEVWVLSERITPGMSAEIEKATKRRQVVRYFNSDFVEVEC